MTDIPWQIIQDIREYSRNLIRELGFLNKTIAGTDLTASQVHALVEIGNAGTIYARDLSDILLLEKSTISRLVKKLITRGELYESPSPTDIRKKIIQLTPQGKNTVQQITKFAEQQVIAALTTLPQSTRTEIAQGLHKYSKALKNCRLESDQKPGLQKEDPVEIVQGHKTGLIGRIIEMHAHYYSEFADFDDAFEATVTKGLGDFFPRLGREENAVWSASYKNKIIGSIAIDGQDLGENIAHLRWFIVESHGRPKGLGKALLNHALRFCDERGFKETHLWTFKGLDAARNLYEKNGFVLVDEYSGDQWGKTVMEQKFIRKNSKTY
ncbi:bifunctional helix-turn-helix transcriptional regulator/GNAT family N-acetyltransferase [Kiloniella majae]|uniref:bifunctional helix-turn-helix transcriptional regulator/GNAT family N-acetyltransferase n=1 Tax=Kiloniella majae TaxID=1938558 RepID=UPI000A278469|nr:helix-turn-helix domain-containing GNAT family N-acetyltransferase [Kiloniella majae]